MGAEFDYARRQYEDIGVDVEKAFKSLEGISLSLHCWQGDDVGGFERQGATLSGGGIQVTGNHPGKARNPDELRRDIEKALSFIPGKHRVNLHASYGEFGGKPVDRDAIEPAHFSRWIDWAASRGLGLDFNSTLFSHPLAASGFTLSSKDAPTREFWIEHVRRCRDVASAMGKALGTPCVHNLWIPDGAKDLTCDRMGYRAILRESLDAIYAHKHPASEMRDAVESKLFGIGSESFVVGSHEFYMGYALMRGLFLCLDTGHFHQTESVADKVSAIFQFQDELLLHVSRPMRWDSDHVVILTDDLAALMEELVRSGKIAKAHIGLDFFDGTINRLGAWTIGARSTQKALLRALLEPRARMLAAEESDNGFERLALIELGKTLPLGIVWDEYCRRKGVPSDLEAIAKINDYEKDVLLCR